MSRFPLAVLGRILLAVVLLTVGSTGTVDGGKRRAMFSQHVPVLMYHNFGCPPAGDNGQFWVCPDTFTAQMQALKDAGWLSITADRIATKMASRTPILPYRFAITIDDGGETGYTVALPLLRSLGMVATFYIVTDLIGTPGYMTWDQVRELRDAGMDIGNHTTDHPHMPTLTADQQFAQMYIAQSELLTQVGKLPTTVAYPFGENNLDTRTEAKAAGLLLGFTIVPGGIESVSTPMLCPRYHVDENMTPQQLLHLVAPFAT